MNSRDMRLQEARQACRRSDYQAAYAIYEALLQSNLEDPAVLLDYGRAKYQEYVDLDQATTLFERALAADPQSVDACLWLADMYALGYGRGYAAAAELYRRASELDAQAVDAYIGLGMLHQAPGAPVRLDEAISAFRTATQLDGQRADARLDLGMALLRANDRQAARHELSIAERLLATSGNQRQAAGLRSLLGRLERNEPITSTVYSLDSPRYRWLDQD